MSQPTSNSFKDFVLDQLRSLDGVTSRAMFGGWGLYGGEVFFGIISDDRLYFKTDGVTRETYVSAGMGPFVASAKQTLKNYYEVPAEVLESHDELAAWAREAMGV